MINSAATTPSPRNLHQTWPHHHGIRQMDRLRRTQPSLPHRPPKPSPGNPTPHQGRSRSNEPLLQHPRPTKRKNDPNVQSRLQIQTQKSRCRLTNRLLEVDLRHQPGTRHRHLCLPLVHRGGRCTRQDFRTSCHYWIQHADY